MGSEEVVRQLLIVRIKTGEIALSNRTANSVTIGLGTQHPIMDSTTVHEHSHRGNIYTLLHLSNSGKHVYNYIQV